MVLIPLITLITGCTTSLGSLAVDAALLLSATSGAEEKTVSSGDAVSPDDLPAALTPDPFRTCDAGSTYADLFGQFDADTDGVLDAAEAGTVQDTFDQAPGGADRLWMQWGMLLLAYDEDLDGALSETERATLLADFTTRCEVLQDKLIADFDADGDGVLSEAEQATAEAALAAEEAEHHSCEGMGGEGDTAGPEGDGPPDGDSGARGGDPFHLGPPEGAMVEVDGVPIAPPLLDEFDANADGTLDNDEIAALRAAIRGRITSGDPLMPPPPEGGPGGH